MLKFEIKEETFGGTVKKFCVDFDADEGCDGVEIFDSSSGALMNEFETHGNALDALKMIRHRLDEAIRQEEAKAAQAGEAVIFSTICNCPLCQRKRSRQDRFCKYAAWNRSPMDDSNSR